MTKITTMEELQESILVLEKKQADSLTELREQLKTTYESLKPINLIKNAVGELIASPDLKNGLFNTVLSMAAGKLSKKVIVGATHNPIKQILGTLLQMGVTSIVSKNSDEIKSGGLKLLSSLFKRKEKIPTE